MRTAALADAAPPKKPAMAVMITLIMSRILIIVSRFMILFLVGGLVHTPTCAKVQKWF